MNQLNKNADALKLASLMGFFAVVVMVVVWLFIAFVKWDFSITASDLRFWAGFAFLTALITYCGYWFKVSEP